MRRILAALVLGAGLLAGCARGALPAASSPTPPVVAPTPTRPAPTGSPQAALAPTLPPSTATPDFRLAEEPWPPPTATPGPTPTILPFPTAALAQAASPAEARYRLWYPAYPGLHARPRLEQAQIDEHGRRAAVPARQVDVGLSERSIFLDVPLFGLSVAPGGQYLELDIADQENVFPRILDTVSGRLLPEFTQPGFAFFGWYPDGRRFLGRTEVEMEQPYGSAAELDIPGGGHRTFAYPEREGFLPKINALAAAPSGKWLADSLTYAAVGDRFSPSTTEFGITDLGGGTRDVLCIIDPSASAVPYSLKWSPDEQSLMWISVDVVGENNEQTTYWLWIGSRKTQQCAKTALVRSEPGELFPGGFAAEWSPDGSAIVFIQGQPGAENPLAGNVALLDARTGKVRMVTGFDGAVVSFARFMPDTSQIAFSIRRGAYGEIWTVSRDGGDFRAIAGPTTLDAPFVWIATGK